MDRRRMAFGLLGDTLGTEDILNTPIRRGGILPVTEYPNRTELDLSSGLTGALWDAFTAPDRARRGEISESDMIPEAFNFAGSLTLGSLLAPRPTQSVGMGGRAAKLDMSEAARMARAKEMGFDTSKVWYHGTPEPGITSFEAGRRDPGVWFTTYLNNAASYARGYDGDVHKVYLRYKNPYVVNFTDDMQPTHNGGPINFGNNVDIVKWAEKNGYDSVHFPDGNFSEADDTIVIFDPTNIRSVNAAFDPAKASSANLLAANAKTGAAVPLATKALEAQQPQGIRYLDQMSRGAGEGSSNYVVFDDALIEIMRKYGLLGPVAGLGAAGLLADDGGQVY